MACLASRSIVPFNSPNPSTRHEIPCYSEIGRSPSRVSRLAFIDNHQFLSVVEDNAFITVCCCCQVGMATGAVPLISRRLNPAHFCWVRSPQEPSLHPQPSKWLPYVFVLIYPVDGQEAPQSSATSETPMRAKQPRMKSFSIYRWVSWSKDNFVDAEESGQTLRKTYNAEIQCRFECLWTNGSRCSHQNQGFNLSFVVDL